MAKNRTKTKTITPDKIEDVANEVLATNDFEHVTVFVRALSRAYSELGMVVEDFVKSDHELNQKVASLQVALNLAEVEISDLEKKIEASEIAVENAKYEDFEDVGSW